MMGSRLDGRHALITGGGTGIGAAAAAELAGEGAKLSLLGRRIEPLEAVAETLGIPLGTVRSRLLHAMRGLRAALDADARPAAQEASR